MRRIAPQIKWPKKLLQIFADIWVKGAKRVIIKAPRGGGKSQLIATLGFCLWYLKDRNGIDMGGSMEQAKEVYKYFLDYCSGGTDEDHSILHTLPKKPTLKSTISPSRKYFKCVAASPKQVRGPHPDFLLCDEVCETDDELIRSALPMVGTSDNSLVVMTSTFHKVFGIFQETWDAAPELGYKRYSWDIFDVVKVFDPTIWDDPEFNREVADFAKLKEYSKDDKGQYRTGDSEGWIPIENVIQAWREKPSLDWFEVEYMGHRPSAMGLVLDPVDVENAQFGDNEQTRYNFIKQSETVMGIDWGYSSMTSVNVLMKHLDDVKVLLKNKNYTQTKSEIIIEDVVKDVKAYGIRWIYADSAGAFEIASLISKLGELGISCAVIPVIFSQEKEFMIGNLRAHFQTAKFKFHNKMMLVKWQLKRYRFQEGTDKPLKKDDHIPDSLMCALQHWPLNRKPVSLVDDTQEQHDAGLAPITAGLRNTKF